MGGIIKGGNSFVPSVPLRVAVRHGLDVSALLLTERGRVRGDGDVVFHGAPVHPSGSVRLVGGEDGTEWLEVGLTAIEEDIVRLLVVASTENGCVQDADGPSVEAFAPDGTSVARYDVTDGGGETAMVMAEFYRRAGGWKFRAVGQGYLDGLAGLAADHGVDVARDEPGPETIHTPVPAPVAVPAPMSASAPGAVPAPAAVVPQPLVSGAGDPWMDWSFGPVFEPYTETGRDNDVITVDGLPPGPVVVELNVEGDGYTGLWTLDRRNKQKDNIVNSTEENFRGRLLAEVPEREPLRLRLQAEGPWRVRVLPLAAAQRLTEEQLDYRGPDVLLHTQGVADLAIHYRGDDNLIVHLYELAGHEDSTSLPRGENVVNEIGKRRETVPLPEGPVIIQLEMADGPWRARLKRLQPHSRPVTAAPVPRTAPLQVADGGSTGGVAKVSENRKVQKWAWRGKR
ncbi:TerD family protein [Streptomyces sp. NPDC002596]